MRETPTTCVENEANEIRAEIERLRVELAAVKEHRDMCSARVAESEAAEWRNEQSVITWQEEHDIQEKRADTAEARVVELEAALLQARNDVENGRAFRRDIVAAIDAALGSGK